MRGREIILGLAATAAFTPEASSQTTSQPNTGVIGEKVGDVATNNLFFQTYDYRTRGTDGSLFAPPLPSDREDVFNLYYGEHRPKNEPNTIQFLPNTIELKDIIKEYPRTTKIRPDGNYGSVYLNYGPQQTVHSASFTPHPFFENAANKNGGNIDVRAKFVNEFMGNVTGKPVPTEISEEVYNQALKCGRHSPDESGNGYTVDLDGHTATVVDSYQTKAMEDSTSYKDNVIGDCKITITKKGVEPYTTPEDTNAGWPSIPEKWSKAALGSVIFIALR